MCNLKGVKRKMEISIDLGQNRRNKKLQLLSSCAIPPKQKEKKLKKLKQRTTGHSETEINEIERQMRLRESSTTILGGGCRRSQNRETEKPKNRRQQQPRLLRFWRQKTTASGGGGERR